jgi:hypothetical protein
MLFGSKMILSVKCCSTAQLKLEVVFLWQTEKQRSWSDGWHHVTLSRCLCGSNCCTYTLVSLEAAACWLTIPPHINTIYIYIYIYIYTWDTVHPVIGKIEGVACSKSYWVIATNAQDNILNSGKNISCWGRGKEKDGHTTHWTTQPRQKSQVQPSNALSLTRRCRILLTRVNCYHSRANVVTSCCK